MGAAEGHESRYLIPFGDYVIGIVAEVRDGGVHPPDQVLVPVDAMLVFGNHVAGENVRATNSSAASGLCWFQTSSYNRRMRALFSSDIEIPPSPGNPSWVAPSVTM